MRKPQIKIYYSGVPSVLAVPNPERKKFLETLFSELKTSIA